jgi:DNA-binding transcriptional regulator LsrR (DeoR family)
LNEELESLLKLTARLYHVDGLSQTEIANVIGVSRTKVSRLLTRALQEGIVRISVEEYDPRNRALEDKLKNQFNLNHAIVIKLLGETDIENVRSTVGYLAAPYVSEWIYPNAVVGLSGSRSLYRLIQNLKPHTGSRGVTVVQLMGHIGAGVSNYDSIELCRNLADSFLGNYFILNAPAFAPDIRSRQILTAHHDVVAVWKYFSQMQIAFVGIGSLTHSSFIERGVFDQEDVEKLRNYGVVGEMCGRFYDQLGQECAEEYQQRVIGISLEELREKDVVAVTCGAQRAEAIYAALCGGLIRSLVIDEIGAEAVLALQQAAVQTNQSI